MAKIRFKNGQYQACKALPGGQWEVHGLPSLDDALRVAGLEPEMSERAAECGKDCSLDGLWGELAR